MPRNMTNYSEIIEEFGSIHEVQEKLTEYPSSSFLNYSDESIDKLFCLLDELPSPIKEQVFVNFCLARSGLQNLLQ